MSRIDTIINNGNYNRTGALGYVPGFGSVNVSIRNAALLAGVVKVLLLPEKWIIRCEVELCFADEVWGGPFDLRILKELASQCKRIAARIGLASEVRIHPRGTDSLDQGEAGSLKVLLDINGCKPSLKS